LQAKDVKDKARKIEKQFGSDFFFANEPDSESMLAMAFKQVVIQQLSNFRLEVFSPGSERDFQDLGKPRKVQTHKVYKFLIFLLCLLLANLLMHTRGLWIVVSAHQMESFCLLSLKPFSPVSLRMPGKITLGV
jgi:hypothetical protein